MRRPEDADTVRETERSAAENPAHPVVSHSARQEFRVRLHDVCPAAVKSEAGYRLRGLRPREVVEAEAEDFDGFADQDGCPDLDNDQDGIPDVKDLAPDLPEDVDGFEDSDGRPDRDNDGDGITDDKDACPNEAEDFDGDRDVDGCPDLERSAPEGSSSPGRP